MNPIIRLACGDDRTPILRFINEHWKRDHIFVHSRVLFDWQHLSSAHAGQFNFVLALHPTSHDILALLGFIPMSQFSLRLEWSETFLAIWKVRDDIRLPGLGVGLLESVVRHTQPAMIGVVGISRMAVPLYRVLGFQTGLLDHHVLFNPRRRTFLIASGVESRHMPTVAPFDSAVRCVPLTNACASQTIEALCAASVPRKTWDYVRHRYLQHPFYRYQVLGLSRDGALDAILIARKVHANQSAALRITDYLGDAGVLPRFQGALQNILVSENAEYLDIYQHGIPDDLLTAAGFVNRRQQPSLTVPNYFEPFENANIELDFAYRVYDPLLSGRIRILRGDGDQDRPNQLPQDQNGGSQWTEPN
jgi:hypothetical protein